MPPVPASTWVLFKRFVHLRRFAFTAFLPLLGAASASPETTLVELLVIAIVAWHYHVYTYALNDVIDLPVDRLLHKRADHPLVRGDIRPSTALAIALAQLPLAFVLTWLIGGSPYRYAALVIAVVFMATYDIWGKRFSFPPLTDLVQALAWGALTLYGALVVGEPSFLTFVLAAIFVVFILLMNGVFEGVIDFAGDSAAGLRTTAMSFGVTAPEGRPLVIPHRLVIYGLLLEAALIALSLLPLIRNDFGYGPAVRVPIIVAVAALGVAVVLFSLRLVSPWPRFRIAIRDEHIDVMSALSVVILLVSYALYLEPLTIGVIAVFTIAPFVL